MRLMSWGPPPRQAAWAVGLGGASPPAYLPAAAQLELVALRAELQRLQAELERLLAAPSASPAWPPPASLPQPPGPVGLPPPSLPPPPAPVGLPPPVVPAPPPPAPPAPWTLPAGDRWEAPRPARSQGPAVRQGLQGEPVRALQARLRDLGFNPGPLDGLFGPLTEAAVRAFQRSRGLAADGVVGPDSWAALGVTATGSVRPWGNQAPPTPGEMVPGASIPLVSRQGHQMHAALARDWDRMVEAAARDGVRLAITSGYRSVAHQQRLWDAALRKYGSAAAARKWVAPPGRSNHQQGKALDIANNGGAHAWLRRNGHRFGFSQPMSWEPWHWEHAI